MKKICLLLLVMMTSFLGSISVVSADMWSEITGAYDSTLGNLDVNEIDTECMLDMLNDRFGIDAGTPFQLLGEGTNLLGDGLDWAGVGGGDTVRSIGGAVGGFGDNLSDVDLNDIGLDDVMNILDPSNKPVFDGPGIRRGARIVKCNIDRGISTEKDLNVLALGWVNFALSIVAVIAVIAIIYAGFLYIVSGGDDTDKAKKILLYVAVGIIMILSAYAVVNTLIAEPRQGGGDEISQINDFHI
jgi:hypothetical protein